MDRQVADQHVATQQTVSRPAWSPAQLVAIVIGIIYLVLGGVALARAGLDFTPIRHVQVAGLDHTALLGLIAFVFGLLVLGIGALPGADRSGMIASGIVAIAGGLIVIIEPTAFHRTLGVHSGNGWLYFITGIVLLVAGMLSPVILSRRSTRFDDRAVITDPTPLP